MRFFVRRSEYERIEDLLFTERQNVRALSGQNEGLHALVKEGERYRETLEKRNEALLEDNRILYEGREQARKELAMTKELLKNEVLLRKSMEASWCGRKSGEEEEIA
jgi:hypothetical protein